MAAVVLSRSRGVAGARTTKGLFFIFTVLSLLCLASSQFDKKQLKKLKETLQKSELDMDSLQAEYNIKVDEFAAKLQNNEETLKRLKELVETLDENLAEL